MGNIAGALTIQSEEAALIAELRAGSEQAFAWLERAYKEHSMILQYIKVHPFFDPSAAIPVSRTWRAASGLILFRPDYFRLPDEPGTRKNGVSCLDLLQDTCAAYQLLEARIGVQTL